MGFTKKQCREQKKAHFARKIYHRGSPKSTAQKKANQQPEQVKESAVPTRPE